MTTTTLFKIIQSELIKLGRNEFEGKEKQTSVFDFGTFDFFKDDMQFTGKLFKYDDDIKLIVNWLFSDMSLEEKEYDEHFKKMFVFKFLNRQISKQTVERFKYDVGYMFMTRQDYLNRIYRDGEKYINRLNENVSNSKSKGKSNTQSDNKNDGKSETTDRGADSDLPNSTLSFNLDNDIFDNPSSANARKNKTTNSNTATSKQTSDNENEDNNESHSNTYTLDDLIKSSYLLDDVLKEFDKKCFLQIW